MMRSCSFKINLSLAVMVLIIPLTAYAGGNAEKNENYRTELAKVFNETVAGIYSDEISLSAGHEELKTLRARYDVSYTDESGVLDSMLDRVYEGTMSPAETKYYFSLMQDKKLSEYRTLTYQKRFDLHQNELMGLMESIIADSPADSVSVSELRNTMNNYYDFFGLRFGEEYRLLNKLLIMFEDGELSIEGLKVELAALGKDPADSASADSEYSDSAAVSAGSEYKSGTASSSGNSESSSAAEGASESSGSSNAQSGSSSLQADSAQAGSSANSGGQGAPKRSLKN